MHLYQHCHRLFSAALFMFLMISHGAQAGMVDLTLFGETTSASYGNSFGLDAGDQVSLKATFDYSVISGSGLESVGFGMDSGNSLSLFMGDLTFKADNSLGFPLISFIDGIFSGIDYFSYSGENGAPENLFSHGTHWASIGTINNNNSLQSASMSQAWVSGIWDDNTLSITETPDIPEPGPLALAGIGLLGAWIASRRRKTFS